MSELVIILLAFLAILAILFYVYENVLKPFFSFLQHLSSSTTDIITDAIEIADKRQEKTHKHPNNLPIDFNTESHKKAKIPIEKIDKLGRFRLMKEKYLKSDKWIEKRQQVLKRDNFQCTNCSTSAYLDVHHIRYDKIPNEPLSHLITLCRDCHKKRHQQSGYPQSHEDYMNKTY